MRILTLLLAASFLASCSGGTETGPTDTRLAGTWAQRTAVSGTSFVLKLVVQGTAVTGNGTYSSDNGRSGDVVATGSTADGSLRLSLSYGGEPAQFTGSRIGESELAGSLHFGPAGALTPSQAVAFDRQN